MEMTPQRRRLILIGLVIVVVLCLVGILALRQFLPGDDGVAADTPTPAATPTDEGPVVIVTPEDEATATPTRVIGEDEEPTEESTPEATEVASEPATESTPQAAATSSPTDADFVPAPPDTESSAVLQTGDILKNGGFEGGFDDLGVGVDWQHFRTDGAIVSFSSETFEALIKDGSNAQRISVEQALQPDRYAGIYQTLKVVPDRTYTFTIYGQARTLFGDVDKSGYGYRVQYAVDYEGGDDWQQIPQEDWVELPWGEQMLTADNPSLSEYTVEITPTSDRITLFVRVWNKWPDPSLVEYTFDSLSLVGPVSGTAVASASSTTIGSTTTTTGTTTTSEEAMIDQPLPVTGTVDITGFIGDARFWGGILVLLLLGVGAIYRARWRW